jgi:hypothetical protein
MAAKKSKDNKRASLVATDVQGQRLDLINRKYILVSTTTPYLIVRLLQTPLDATVWIEFERAN